MDDVALLTFAHGQIRSKSCSQCGSLYPSTNGSFLPSAEAPVHKMQLLTYLKLADKRLGLLINFNVVLIKDGITRIVNGLKE